MTLSASKVCNGCKRTVARKSGPFFHTVKSYVTIRGDDVVSYCNYEDHTTAYKLHYCEDCWKLIVPKIEEALND